jgi:hypothetical protein
MDAGAREAAGAGGGASLFGAASRLHAASARKAAHAQRAATSRLKGGIDLYYRRRMARGFESKMVEFNQEEAARAKTLKPGISADERDRAAKRRAIELARARAVADLERATVPAHKHMLEEAIRALDEQLRSI